MLSSNAYYYRSTKSHPPSDVKGIPWLELAKTPRVYYLFDTIEEEKTARESKLHREGTYEDKKAENFSFAIIGCQGERNKKQKDVAKLLAQVVEKEEAKFCIGLGDTVYTNGAKRPDDPIIKESFDDIYLIHEKLKKIVTFLVFGNHDLNIHRFGDSLEEAMNVGINEIIYTYLNANSKLDQQKYDYLNQPYISLEGLAALKINWFLPSSFYSIVYKNTLFIYSNSSLYAHDYLEYQKTTSTENLAFNQAYWIEMLIKQFPSLEKIWVGHHSFETAGKRDDDPDTRYYLSKSEIEELNERGISGGFNTILRGILQDQGILEHLTMNLAAHDHMNYYLNDRLTEGQKNGICQLTVGGSGGNADTIKKFNKMPHIFGFSETGCAVITTSEEKDYQFLLKLYDSQDLSCCFTNTDAKPYINYKSIRIADREIYSSFSKVMRKALYSYFASLSEEKGLSKLFSHGPDKRALDLLLIINQHEPTSLSMMLQQIVHVLHNNKLPLEQEAPLDFEPFKACPLLQFINREIDSIYHCDLRHFIDKHLKQTKKVLLPRIDTGIELTAFS